MQEPPEERTLKLQYSQQGYQLVLDDGTPIKNVISVALDVWPRQDAVLTLRLIVNDIELIHREQA